MLVLNRKIEDTIVIKNIQRDDLIIIKLLSMQGQKQIKIGIKASKNYSIFREEIYKPNLKKENDV